MARRLLSDGVVGEAPPEAVAATMQRVCNRSSENLRRAVGDDGYNALIARALRRTESQHAALSDIRRVAETGIHLDGVVASVRKHGVTAVSDALEALFTALVDVLSGLIGADMVLSLLEHDGPPHDAAEGRHDDIP
jgi:hypothetical protein